MNRKEKKKEERFSKKKRFRVKLDPSFECDLHFFYLIFLLFFFFLFFIDRVSSRFDIVLFC